MTNAQDKFPGCGLAYDDWNATIWIEAQEPLHTTVSGAIPWAYV